MQKNKGFTLVELIIAVAILSVVLVSITSMMVIGSKSFAKGNADAEMQREAQLVVDQIEDMIIDTNGGVDYVVAADSKKLILYNREADDSGTKEIVNWNKDYETITYSKYNVEYDSASKTFVDTGVISNNELLAEGVRDFDVDVSDTVDEYNEDGEQITIVQSVKIMAEYVGAEGKVAYATTPVITLRNRMMLTGNPKFIFEEPPYEEPKVLAVEVNVLGSQTDPGYYNITVMSRGTVTASGFQENELRYEWSTNVDWVYFVGENTNPDECLVRIDYSAWQVHAGETIAITLTATPTVSLEVSPVSGTDTYTLPPLGDFGDTYHERGATDGRSHYYIDDYLNYNAFDYEIYFKDAKGNLYPNQDELKSLVIVELEQGGFAFQVMEGLDSTKEYFVTVIVHARNANGDEKAFTRTLYIPAVMIKSTSPVCTWAGFDTIYGQGFTGDGIGYIVEGYLREQWWKNNPYDVTMTGYVADGMPTGTKLQLLIPSKISIPDDIGSNEFRLPFQLKVINEDGTAYQGDKSSISVKSITVEIRMNTPGCENVFGMVTVTFTE